MDSRLSNELRREQVRSWIKKSGTVKHSQGSIVLGPQGSGKSWFVKHRGQGQWADVDEFLGPFLKFHTEEWHNKKHTQAEVEAHYRECDNYLKAMKEEGCWVVGALFWEYVPDAIVILDEAQHRKYVAQRDDLDWESVKRVREFLRKQSREHSVPIYNNWDDLAARYQMAQFPVATVTSSGYAF